MDKDIATMEVCTKALARLALAATCAVGLMSGTAAAQTYTVTDLGTLGGGFSTGLAINASGQVAGISWVPNGIDLHGFLFSNGVMTDVGTFGGPQSLSLAINAAGHVAGGAFLADQSEHAFVFANGVMNDLGTLDGWSSRAVAINTAGQVTGVGSVPGGFHAFKYSNGVMTDLGTLGGSLSRGFAINDAGQVTGAAWTADNEPHAFLYSNGAMTDLGTLAGGSYSAGLAINATGQVAGEGYVNGTELHAFLYSNGVMTDLGTFGGTRSTAAAINASGHVVGAASLPGDATQHAFVYANGVLTDLGTLGGVASAAFAINTAGQITGGSKIAVGDPESIPPDHAFLYTDGMMIDLNAVIPSEPGWTLNVGWAINDRGQITGMGLIHGEQHAFLLTPVATRTTEVQQPIDPDGSSVFNARRGVIPVRFTLIENGSATCQLPPATIAITRTAGGTIGPVDESVYVASADTGPAFRISNCQYVYNLGASGLGAGHYRVEIKIDGASVGHAEFSLR